MNIFLQFIPIALRKAKTLWSFDRSECNRVKSGSIFVPNYHKYVSPVVQL